MCDDAELQRHKFPSKFPQSSKDCEKYANSTSVITKLKYLKCVKGYPLHCRSSEPSWPQNRISRSPKANMYYAFNEDTNPFTRVSEFIDTGCDCDAKDAMREPHFPPPLDPFTDRDPYSEKEARQKQLTTSPACFVVFGKPELGGKKLAKLIAEERNCILISPEILLREEIAAKTDKGRWMKQVLRSGRSLGPEIIMNLVESRVSGKDVMHRGYVVEGLPLIPNDPDLDYAAYPLPPSLRNLNTPEEKARVNRGNYEGGESEEEIMIRSAGYEEEEEDEAFPELPESGEESFASNSSKSYDLARNPFATDSLRMILRDDYPWDIGNQVREMFTAWPLKPSVIIYTICPDPDVVHRRSQFRLDPYTGNTIDAGLWRLEEKLEVGVDTEKESVELDREIAKEEEFVGEEFKKHLLRRITNMRANVESQCKIFERLALPAIEKQVLAHNPERVIRVDGRTSAMRMFQVVRARLKILRLPRVIFPIKIFDNEAGEKSEGEEDSFEEDFEGKNNEEALRELMMKNAISQRFQWRLSRWKFLCPVALARGKKIEGSVKHAVRFMNRIYFLSSAAAAERFIENPRPFLLPPNPRPICKVLIYGPERSGKSNLAEFLAHSFAARLLDLRAIENREVEHRRNEMIRYAVDEIRNQVIDELIEDLENQRDEREVARIAALDVWYKKARVVADKLLQIMRNGSNEKNDGVETYDDIEQGIKNMREEIEEYNLTTLCTDRELRERIMWDKNVLMDFAPTELLVMEPLVDELDEQDSRVAEVLIERTQEARQATIELKIEEIGKLLVANINAAQTAPNSLGFQESGWVVDGMYPNVELLEILMRNGVEVEEVVVIHEAEPYEYLIDKWRKSRGTHEKDLEEMEEQEEDEDEDEDEDGDEKETIIEGSVKLNNADNIEGVRDVEDEHGTLLSKRSSSSDTIFLALNKYIRDLESFDASWDIVVEMIRELGIRIIDVQLPVESDLESHVKKQIDERYHEIASIMTDEEKDRETEDANGFEISSNYEEFTEEEEDLNEESPPRKDKRRLGDTGPYCPVALRRHHVFWRGKEEFSALFTDKIYLLSSQVTLDEFIRQPHEFAAYKKPLESIPPLRVSIVGPIGSGKSTLAKAISLEYGLAHIDFCKRLDLYLQDRGVPLVGRKHEEDFLIDNTDERQTLKTEFEEITELPEDLNDQRYNSDKATIRAFVQKYLKEGAVLPNRMLRECLTDFFHPPYRSTGLVFDNFPASFHDASAACENFAVPEIVVELTCGMEKSRVRMTSKLYNAWKEKQDKKKSDEETRFATEMRKTIEKREKWIRKKMKERRKLRRARSPTNGEDDEENDNDEEEEIEEIENGEMEDESNVKDLKSKETIESNDSDDSTTADLDSSQAEIDRAKLQEEAWIQYKDPVKFEDWEDPEVAMERIRQEVDQDYESSSEKLSTARSLFEEQSIPWVEIDGEKNETSVLILAMKILDPYIFRTPSTLERVYEIDADIAERLLDCGYYFLSSFGRLCPVQMYDDQIPFSILSIPEQESQQIFPVLHRDYVYFIAGKERLASFTEHPLIYLEQDSCTPSIPARIAVIGPPKSGKTTVANRFASTYGLKAITRGQALRHTLRHFSWTELANLTNIHLRGGHTALNESISRAVELYSIDPRGTSRGYVLDGFPESQAEAEELAFLGIRPMVVVDLRADLDFCLRCLSTESDSFSRPPIHSPCYFSHRYEEWEKSSGNFRSWLKNFAQNVCEVDATARKFAVWKCADHEVRQRFFRIKRYFREADYDKAHSLTSMCISPYEFRQRQSKLESYCPVCLGFDDVLTLSDTPPSHEGMVQFREHFYWVCKAHLDDFLNDPWAIFSSMKDLALPESRPEIVDQEIDVNHACWAKRVKISGFCPVTYLDNLPQRQVVAGLKTLGVMFRDGLYLFCSVECRDKFISRPAKYADVEINFKQSLPPVRINSLPNLGFLEQTVAGLIVRAVNTVSVLRAKLPGMTAEVTAAVYIGVYLKIHNTDGDLEEVAVYEEVMRRMNARRHLLQVALKNAKKMINPYVFFPLEDKNVESEIYGGIKPPSVTSSSVEFPSDVLSPQRESFDKFSRTSSGSRSSISRRVPVPDARFDYLCEYFKPVSKVPGFLNVVDIAGLVKGAAEGQGLGNAFLSHISACDAIFHLCRAFEDDDVTHIEGEVNPVQDLDTISEELRLKDIEFLGAHLEKLEKLVVRGNDKKLKPEYETLLKVKSTLIDEKRHIRFADWSANDIEVLNKYLFLTSKPVIYLVNLSEKDYIRKKNKWLIKIKEWVDKNDPGSILVPFSGIFENQIVDMDDAERAKYFEEHKATSALDKIIVQGYKALQLQYFFTAGHDEVKAWTIPKGAKAPQAAGRIHTDFEKGFIMAEVMKFDDFKNEGSETAVKAAGKYRQQGRNYVVEDGDIIFFKFNAGAGLKDAKKK